MVFRKKSKLEERIAWIRERLKQIEKDIKVGNKRAGKYGVKGETNKLLQERTQIAILETKRKEYLGELDTVDVTPMIMDSTVPFSEDTKREAYKWIKGDDSNYHCYLKIIEKNPAVLKEVHKIAVEYLEKGKDLPTDYILIRREKEVDK